MMKYLLPICILVFSFHVFSQNKINALKFDEFYYDPHQQSDPLIERGNRFAQQVKKEPIENRALIIFYNQRKGKYPLDQGEDWANYTKGIMVNGYKIAANRVSILDGGYRETASLEYWILPPGAAVPTAFPEFRGDETIICPEINIAGDGFMHDRTKPLRFSVVVSGKAPGTDLKYEWNVSVGKIIDGQGTNIVKVDLNRSEAKRVTASLRVYGLSPECNDRVFATTEVGLFPYKLAEINYNYSEFAALMDLLYIELNENPKFRGYVIIYGSRKGNSVETASRITEAKKYLAFRRYDTSRVSMINGGYREEVAIEFFVVPPDVSLPKPTPTLNEKFVTFTDRRKRRY
jgi:hypothetical protein